MATSGYRTIDEKSSTSYAVDKSDVAGNGTGDGRIEAVARGAGAAASTARNAVAQIISAPMPDVNLYTEPLNPSAQLTLNDRVQLVLESCRPWAEFADVKAINFPPASEVKLRVGHNAEIFFYNYLVVGFGVLTLTAFFHPLRSILVATVVLAAFLLYIIFPEDYRVGENFYISRPLKHIIMGALVLFSLTLGHVLSLFFFFVSIFVPVVLLHAILREHSATVVSTI